MVKIGRPTVFSPSVIKKLEEAFAMDCTVSEACLHADIIPQTYYNNVKEKPELLERFTELRNKPYLKARKTIIDSLSNPKDAQWYLERKAKKEFAARTELTGAEGKELPTPIIQIDRDVHTN